MISKLLDRLAKVRQIKTGQWVACCPVHEDKTPSMGIKLNDNGKILLHCFGCGAGGIEIIQALGMSPEDLFPPDKNPSETRQKREYFHVETILKTLDTEAYILVLAASDVLNGTINKDDAERVLLASNRIREAYNYCIK